MGAILDKDGIKKIIPHRDPILLIDEVSEMKIGEDIKTKYYVSGEMEIFKGHFPGDPVLPGVYTVECMAQTADVLILSMERYAGKTPLFIGIDKVKFKKKIEPGDTIEVYAKIIKENVEKAIVVCEATAFNKGEEAAVGEVALAMR